MFTRFLPATLAAATLAWCPAALWALDAPPTNVILFIGDGMSINSVTAASYYKTGTAEGLNWQQFPSYSTTTTFSANNAVTDSAAAGSALATGCKVNNGVISQALGTHALSATPADGRDLPTSLEFFKNLGRSTGLITTSYMTDATPAAFGAHENSRNNAANIANDLLYGSRPNVLFGGGNNMSGAAAAGYTVANNRTTMNALSNTATHVSGQFGTGGLFPYVYDQNASYTAGVPYLHEMTTKALNILDQKNTGFFLMVENENIDEAGHAQNRNRMLTEILELEKAVQAAIDWASGRNDTLIIVTADHDTGGMYNVINNGAGVFPTVSFLHGSHTSNPVGIWAWGANAHLLSGVTDNTHVYGFVTSPLVPEPASMALLALGGLMLLPRRR